MSRHKKREGFEFELLVAMAATCLSVDICPTCKLQAAPPRASNQHSLSNSCVFVYSCICVLLYFYLSKTLQERLFFFQLNRNSILRWTPGRFFSLTLCWRVTRPSWSFLIANLLSQGNDGSSKKCSSSKSRQQVLESDSHSGLHC